MKRRYKLIIIILIGSILTFLINTFKTSTKTNVTSLGDGFSIGITTHNIIGKSFNDYFVNLLEKNKDLNTYNYEFSYQHQTSHELNENIKGNNIGYKSKIPIKQIIAKTDILTISIGMDEFASITSIDEIKPEMITNYIEEITQILSQIREFYDKKIILIGLYPTSNILQKDIIEINTRLKKVCGQYNTYFVDVLALSLNKEYKEETIYLNYKAHEKISQIIYSIYKK